MLTMKKSLALLSLLIVFSQIINAQQTTSTDTARRQQAGTDTARMRFQPAPVGTVTLTRETPVHDPVMIKQGDKYYLFCTGGGISVFSSKDMKNWRKEAPVFAKAPEWVVKAIPTFKGNSIWAPNINYYNGRYYL